MSAAFTDAEILAAIGKVNEALPFRGYLTQGKVRRILHLVRAITRYQSPSGGRLLDIGSGPMDVTAVFAQLGYDCSAADDLSDSWHLRDDNREKIAAFARQMGIDFHLTRSDDHSLPFEEGAFDVVNLNSIIEHLHESPRDLLNTAGSYLKSGGLLCITTPNAVNLRKRISVLCGRSNYPPVEQLFHCCGAWRGHVREYTLSEVAYICRAAGYEVLGASTFEVVAYDRLRGPVLQAYLLLSRMIPGCRSALCVIARKPADWSPVTEDADAYRAAVARSVPPGVR